MTRPRWRPAQGWAGYAAELKARTEAHVSEVAQWKAADIPLGGCPVGTGVNPTSWHYPLVCICETPVPEWVYVAYQCATCKRLIQETTA